MARRRDAEGRLVDSEGKTLSQRMYGTPEEQRRVAAEMAEEDVRAVLEAVRSLSYRERQVLIRRFIEGASCARIAPTFGVTEDGITQIERQALKAVAQRYLASYCTTGANETGGSA